jgi:hypothetical protein
MPFQGPGDHERVQETMGGGGGHAEGLDDVAVAHIAALLRQRSYPVGRDCHEGILA